MEGSVIPLNFMIYAMLIINQVEKFRNARVDELQVYTPERVSMAALTLLIFLEYLFDPVTGIFALILALKVMVDSLMWIWEPSFKREHPVLFDYLHIIAAVVAAIVLPHGKQALFSWFILGEPVVGYTELYLLSAGLCGTTVAALELWSRYSGRQHGVIQEILEAAIATRAMIPIFAGMNALQEEIEYRGVTLSALLHVTYSPSNEKPLIDPYSSNTMFACAFQGVLFGLDHYLSGFPSGVSGLVLTSGWGVALGLLNCFSGGMLLSYMVHVVADAMIGFLVLRHAKQQKD